uniref:Coat protein n=1 Tax=Glyptostrobus pensilis prunevirus TaxID=2765862 RepID=A0A8D9PH54_9VIRU|nr:TPA_exp: coat protein [Glyptostrobus pensilis prunevirus]
MSAKNLKKRFIHDEVSEWIWKNFIDPEDLMGCWATSRDGTVRVIDRNRMDQRARIQVDRMKVIFGNIADYSAGPTTNFPSVTVSFSVMQVNGITDVANMDGSFNVRTLVENLKTFIVTHQDQRISQSTLREVCRSFANFALEYYREDESRSSNLADKMPQLALQAREVMFDFSDGISPEFLRAFPNRAKVIQELGSRLLQTSGTKAVFEARGVVESAVNLII